MQIYIFKKNNKMDTYNVLDYSFIVGIEHCIKTTTNNTIFKIS